MTENPVSNPVSETLASINNLTDKQLDELRRGLGSTTLARLSNKSLGARVGGGLKKFLLSLVLFGVGALASGFFLDYVVRKTIAKGERNNAQASWGYSVDQHRLRNRLRLDLWSDSSMFSSASDATFDLNNVSVNKIVEERWLADSRAVFLHLLVNTDGKEQSAKIIYDFQRGEMYTSSPVDLWRVPSAPNQNYKMNDEEFQSVLNKYAGTTAVAPAPNASLAPSVAPSASATAFPSLPASPAPSVSAAPEKTDEQPK